MMRRLYPLLLLLAVWTAPAGAQNGLASNCQRPEVVALDAAETCVAAVQAVVSAQPALGILIAAGNPTIGGAGAAGFRLGLIPRVSAGIRLTVVPVRLPDLLTEQLPGEARAITERYGAPAPAVTGDLAIALTRGFSVAPGLGGIGALTALGSATYLPLHLLDSESFDATDVAFGIGGRVHLLGESFVVPGISLSVMRRQMSEIAFGDVCAVEPVAHTIPNSSPPQQVGVCPVAGDLGEFRADLTAWSGRLIASKNLLGLGLAVGLGRDSYKSDIGIGFRGRALESGTDAAPIFRISNEPLSSSRHTVFGNVAFSLLVAAIGVEAGWQQGTPPVTGFRDLGSNFDPRGGTWYGSVGMRLAL